jgi:hypothetical protein
MIIGKTPSKSVFVSFAPFCSMLLSSAQSAGTRSLQDLTNDHRQNPMQIRLCFLCSLLFKCSSLCPSVYRTDVICIARCFARSSFV